MNADRLAQLDRVFAPGKQPAPANGQTSLFPDVPRVVYCRRCRKRLRGRKSVEAGIGRRCETMEEKGGTTR